MKLVDKFSLWFIAVIVVITPATAYICYFNLKKNIDKTEITRLKELNLRTAARLERGEAFVPEKGAFTEVAKLSGQLPENRVQVQKTDAYDNDAKGMVSLLTVSSYVNIKGQPYRIASYNDIPSAKQIYMVILDTVFWKLLLIILCVAVTIRLVSQRILYSLRLTMKTIQGFHVKQKVKFSGSDSSTHEFKELNTFLQKMTDKAVDEYVAVKEFSENASHELQTPLAILRNKVEMLSETNIGEEQALLLGDMQNAIEKLSKIHRSLTLLAKLENNEYTVSENIRFCKIAKDVLAAYEDRIGMKNITVKTDMDKGIMLKIHPVLADMLVNNLLGNAIRHNVQDGRIEVVLTQKKLVVKNTGLPPVMPTQELFQRFKKSNQCSESIGLGLAIVKQICEVSGFCVSYTYRNQLHILQVDFQPKDKGEVIITAQDNLTPAFV